MGKQDGLSLTPEKIEDKLVEALCKRNGWEYGDNEDYDMAVRDVKWFIENYTQLAKVPLPYLNAILSKKEGKCFWCKTPTRWLDIDYQAYVCSQRCQIEIGEDVKAR